MPEESEVESREHQDNADIHDQSFPESVSEEREIYADYNGCHCHHVKNDSDLSAHFSTPKLVQDEKVPFRDRSCGTNADIGDGRRTPIELLFRCQPDPVSLRRSPKMAM